MNLTSPVINLDKKWYVYHGAHLEKIDKPDELLHSNVILTDFNDSIFGLEAMSGPVEHAAALIEKRLRDIGLLDGPSKIIVHNVRKVGDSAKVLFTAIPVDSYSEYFDLIEKQKDHCLIVPIMSVLYKQLDLTQEKSQVMIFHHDREFDLILVKDKKVSSISRLTAFSTAEEDVNHTIENISKEIQSMNNDVHSPISSIQWLDFLEPKNSSLNYTEKVQALTGVEVVPISGTDIIYDDAEFSTVIPKLVGDVHISDSANDSTSKLLFNSEKFLPLVATVLLAVLVVLSYKLWSWNQQIDEIQTQLASSNKAQLERDIVSIKEDLLKSNKLFANNNTARENSQWLYQLNGIQSVPDPKQLVDDIGSALPEDVQIVGISLDARRVPATVLLDGVIEKPLKLALKDLEDMSTNLYNKGYRMESNSSIELSDNNDFRMTLKVDYNDK